LERRLVAAVELNGALWAGEELIQQEVEALVDQLGNGDCTLFTRGGRRRCGSKGKDWTACGLP
jgi:hypothetical protein